MIEVKTDAFDFYVGGPTWKDRLFRYVGNDKLTNILILIKDDGTETEAILPIEEYRRLKELDNRGK